MSKDSTIINIGGVRLLCTGDYTPRDPGRMYYADGTGQPPTPADFEIESLSILDDENNVDVTELINLLSDYMDRQVAKVKDPRARFAMFNINEMLTDEAIRAKETEADYDD